MLHDVTLTQIALFLAAAVVAAPLAKLLRIGTVLGYLLVGVLIGPFGLGFVYTVYEVDSVLHFAEFGVVLLLFLIGLELRPKRLWTLRANLFGVGGAQVAITGLALAAIGTYFGLAWQTALYAGLALSLSSTAFALQVLEENEELALRHGRMAFAVLLFQDLVAIPLIALTPLFVVSARGSAQPMEILAAIKAIGVILLVVVVGRYVLDGLIRIIARTRVKEAMTACALLTVVGVTLIMEQAGLSASLAHEIKNPLASIRSATEQLAGDGVDAEDRTVLRALVVRESDRLSRLLTEFLDFARVQVRAPEPLHLGGLVKEALDVVRAHPHAEGREVRLEVDPSAAGAVVAADEDLLHRAVLNLALNAVQWAGPGGRVEVALDAVESDILSTALSSTRAVRIRVSDTGPGVPAADAEHVFEPFFTQRPGGSGLGLALVQRAAEAHGGAVFVDEPRPGWGTTFTLYVPETEENGDPSAPPRDPERGEP